MDIYQGAPEIVAVVDEEIAALRSRLKPQSA